MTPSASGVPCLAVDDVRAASAHYRDVLGFEQVALLGGNPPSFAVVRKDSAILLLQQVTDGDRRRRTDRPAGPPWDAVLLVDDVGAAHRDLRTHDTRAVGEIDGKGIGWDSFDLTDPYGNVMCIGQSIDALTAARPQRPGRQSALGRLRTRWQRHCCQREERALLEAFRRFYDQLADKKNVFYMFFTSNLLHWVVQAESFVPPEVNLVLLGSGLTADERGWLAQNVRRPLHHIALPVDDVTAWEFLFAVNQHDFGWLDIDCFVLNGALFDEMTKLEPDAAMNCTWSWMSGLGTRMAGTHFLFVNVAAIRSMESRGVPASPCTYDWTGGTRRFPPRRCFMKVPTQRQRELMIEVLPADEEGRPQFLEGTYFNTLIVYQILATALGYRINAVRDLARRCAQPTDAESTDPAHWPEDMSAELFHLFGISYYKTHRQEAGIRALYLAAEYAMIDGVESRLPAQYRGYKDNLAAELSAAGIDPAVARARFGRHLIEGRRLSAATTDRILRLALADGADAKAAPRT